MTLKRVFGPYTILRLWLRYMAKFDGSLFGVYTSIIFVSSGASCGLVP